MPLDNQQEIFYWVDSKDEPIGTITRQEAHSGSRKTHRSVSVLIFDQQERLLMQQRSKYKDTYPQYWTVSVSGHVAYPQTYEEAVIREVDEEVGLKISPEILVHKGKVFYDVFQEREFINIFVCYPKQTHLAIDSTEIDATAWVEKDNLTSWSASHALTPAAELVLHTLKLI